MNEERIKTTEAIIAAAKLNYKYFRDMSLKMELVLASIIDDEVSQLLQKQRDVEKVKVTCRGWQGHFIGKCHWHLNTLIEFPRGFKVVVSTVGQMPEIFKEGKYREIGADRLFETMAFESSYDKWDDVNVEKSISFNSEWAYNTERKAQKGHWKVVEEIKAKYSK